MQVESAGLGNDVMQASESLSLPLNTLNPEESIEQGVSFFASLLSKADRLGLDLNSVIQAYNYGSGFLDYVYEHGGIYSFELAEEFSRINSGNEKWSTSMKSRLQKRRLSMELWKHVLCGPGEPILTGAS